MRFTFFLPIGLALGTSPKRTLTDCQKPSLLQVDDGHSIYLEVLGNCQGPTLLMFHGGWGPKQTALDIVPSEYRIVHFHQRGWAQSEPMGQVLNNSFSDTLQDAKLIYDTLSENNERWAVAGWSNGATLAMLYAARYPETVMGVVLSGYWAMTGRELSWDYFGPGKRTTFPEEWDRVCDAVGCKGRDLLTLYESKLAGPAGDDGCSSEEPSAACKVACAWLRWDSLGSAIDAVPEDVCIIQANKEPQFYQLHPLATARLGLHQYLHQKHEIPDLLPLVKTGVAVHFVNGRYDMLCPPGSAADVVKQARLLGASSWKATVVEHASHSLSDPGVPEALRSAMLDLLHQEGDQLEIIG